jgi:hypothetical protein
MLPYLRVWPHCMCYVEVNGLAGAWRECDLNLQEEIYPRGCLERGGVGDIAWIRFLFIKMAFPPCTCFPADFQATCLQCVHILSVVFNVSIILSVLSHVLKSHGIMPIVIRFESSWSTMCHSLENVEGASHFILPALNCKLAVYTVLPLLVVIHSLDCMSVWWNCGWVDSCWKIIMIEITTGKLFQKHWMWHVLWVVLSVLEVLALGNSLSELEGFDCEIIA